jgi:HlyD family secretion protein
MFVRSTVPAANLAVVSRHSTSGGARLDAEQSGQGDRLRRSRCSSTTTGTGVIAGESTLFKTRRAARAGKKDQLQERILQLQKEIAGYQAQTEAKVKEIKLVVTELAGMRELWQKKLISIDRLTGMEREATRLDGERGQLMATIAQAEGKIAEIRLQVIQIDLDHSTDVNQELREIDAKAGELVERKVAAEDQLKRIDIRAPQNGIVQQSIAHTVGGVIAQGQTIMQIVPDSDSPDGRSQDRSSDIDQLWPGQPVSLRFSAFNQRTTRRSTELWSGPRPT